MSAFVTIVLVLNYYKKPFRQRIVETPVSRDCCAKSDESFTEAAGRSSSKERQQWETTEAAGTAATCRKCVGLLRVRFPLWTHFSLASQFPCLAASHRTAIRALFETFHVEGAVPFSNAFGRCSVILRLPGPSSKEEKID